MAKCGRFQVSLDAVTIARAKIAGEGNVSLGLRLLAEKADSCTCKPVAIEEPQEDGWAAMHRHAQEQFIAEHGMTPAEYYVRQGKTLSS